MMIKTITKWFTVLLLIGFFSIAHAASVTLTPIEQEVLIGDPAILELYMDFTGEPTLGGGVDIFFDNFVNGNELTFVSYIATNLGDPAFQRNPDVLPRELNGIAFGDFGGLEGPSLVGTLTFQAGNQPGEYFLSMAENDAPAGGFQPDDIDVDFEGASINIVPLPGAVWMLFGALAVVLGVHRRSKRYS